MSASEMSIGMIEQVAGKGAARAARRRRGMDGGVRRPGWVTYALLAVIVLVSAFPLYYAFLLSSSTSSSIAQNPIPSPIPEGHFIENITRVLTADINFWRAVLNSVIVAVLTSVSVVFFSTLAGYAFAKLRFRGREGLMVAVIATMAVPTQLGIIPLFMMMKQFGWTGSLGAVIVPTLVTAFGVFFMRQYLVDVIPDELIEAARVDGASMISTFFNVGIPAARPAMGILSMFTFMTAWTDYLWPLLVVPQNPTLQVALSQLQSAKYVDYSVVLNGAVLATLPLLVLFVIAGKQLVSGIMAGAVKG